MVVNRESIFDTLRRDAPVLRAMGVQRLAVFGSALRGDHTADSDIDFLVDLSPKTFDAYMDVKEHLEARFDCRVDLILRSALKPELRDTVLREAIDAPLD